MTQNEIQAEKVIEIELYNSKSFLNEIGQPSTPDNVLIVFSENIRKMLARHFDLMDEMLKNTQSREAELLKWLAEVKTMIQALTIYEQNMSEKNIKFLDDATKKFINNFELMIKPSIN